MHSEQRRVVYVNQLGQQINKPDVASAPAAAPVYSDNFNHNPSQGTPAPAHQPITTPQQSQAAPSSEGGSISNSTGGGSGGHGVTYSPYKSDHTCKSQAEVDADFAEFASLFGTVRLYGVDCDQVAMVHKALGGSYGNKLLLGLFTLSDIAGQVATMSRGLGGDWSRVDTVSVGNELVNNGGASVAQVVEAVGTARSALRAAGFMGPVVIVDTFNAVIANPQICEASDYCAVNMHPFFDPATAPSQAGAFMTHQLGRVRAAISSPSSSSSSSGGGSGKRVVITETGWPWQGVSNGLAVPGKTEQAVALESIRGAFASDPTSVFLFTAFNDLWKKPEAATFNAEQYWGMGARYSSADGGR